MQNERIENYIEQVDNALELRMLNWVSWVRSGGGRAGSCRSLESRYRAPPMYDYPTLRCEVDLKDAITIEQALVNPTFPKASMAAIVYWYAYPGLHLSAALRKINAFKPAEYVKPTTFDAFFKRSMRMLHNRLRQY
jgi:hypothetical protein